jgi:prophage regulatory protein
VAEVILSTQTQQVSQSPLRILRLPEVVERVGLKRASIYQHMGQGSFPKSISLGPRAIGWIESEIEAWLTAKIKKRKNSETHGI